MSTSRICPSYALLRSLRQATNLRPTTGQTPVCRRAFQTSQLRYEQNSSFRAQLYESTHRRLEREREEQRRLAKERGEPSNGRNAALAFGILVDRGS